jgi:hypothetical protein
MSNWPRQFSLVEAILQNQPVEEIRKIVARDRGFLRVRDDWERLPIHRAVGGRPAVSPDVVRYLIEEWRESLQERDGRGWLPLHIAAAECLDFEVCKVVALAHQAALDERTAENRDVEGSGSLPIHLAVSRTDPSIKCVKALVWWSGRDALLEPDGAGSLPLHLALSQAPQPSSIIPFLIDECLESSNIPDANGSLPLHLAFRRPTSLPAWDVVERLILHCPEALIVSDASGSLPLHLAFRGVTSLPAYEVVERLVRHCPGALADSDADGSLALHLAVAQRRQPPGIVRMLGEACPESDRVANSDGVLAASHCAGSARVALARHCAGSGRSVA